MVVRLIALMLLSTPHIAKALMPFLVSPFPESSNKGRYLLVGIRVINDMQIKSYDQYFAVVREHSFKLTIDTFQDWKVISFFLFAIWKAQYFVMQLDIRLLNNLLQGLTELRCP